jgi:HAMP domain-containing protein
MSRLNIRARIMLVFMLVFIVALVGLTAWFYAFAGQIATQNLQDDLMTSAQITAGLVDPGDFRLAASGDPSAQDRIARHLELIYDSNPNAWNIYLIVPDAPGSDQYTIIAEIYYDDETETAQTGSGDAYDASYLPEVQEALEYPTASSDVREDDYGYWLSGYAPIQDESGVTLGIAGVDMHDYDVQSIRNKILLGSLVGFLLALAGVFVAALLVSGAITRPMRVITGAAQTLEQGEALDPASLEAVSKGSDEVSQLARVFGKMAAEVQAREQKLKLEIHKLKIDLDEKKREQEVKGIIDTEYFRELQKKTKDMRKAKEEQDKE